MLGIPSNDATGSQSLTGVHAQMALFRAFLLLVAVASSSASTSCPTPSSSAIGCFKGVTATDVPTTGGLCSCYCGYSAASGYSPSDYNYAFDVPETFGVSSSAGCTAAACVAAYSSDCTGARYQNATYSTFAASFNATAQTSASGQICYSYTIACPDGSVCSAMGITTGSITRYGKFSGQDSTVSCGLSAAIMSNVAAYSAVNFCNTDACNAPGAALPAGASPSAAAGFAYVLATAAAAVAAVLA